MNCRRVARWLRENLPEAEPPEPVRAHLAGCEACRRVARRQAGLVAVLGQLTSEPVPAELAERVRQAVSARPRHRRRWRLALATVAVTAALVVAIGIRPRQGAAVVEVGAAELAASSLVQQHLLVAADTPQADATALNALSLAVLRADPHLGDRP